MKKFLLLLSTIIFFAHNSLFAQTPAWPPFVFEPWVWEDESTQQSALQLVRDYQAHDIPVGAIIIDSPWETGYNTFEFDTALFPDAQAMVDSFHARGVKVIVWITTAIDTDQHELWHTADSAGYFMKSSAGGGSSIIHWWKGDGSMIDFFNPAAVAWWKTLMDKVLDLGIDGWKCDGTDYSILLGGSTYSPGAARTVSRIEYSHAYYRLFHDYTRQRLGNDRANMSRPVDNYGYTFITDPNLVSFTPRDIGFACWVGDQDATYAGMKNALNNMYQSDANNYLAFGSDVGGYRDQNVPNGRDKDLFVRWAQLGAFSPLMENGGGGEHRPWIFDAQTDSIYRKFARIHQAMVPYQMQQADSLYALSQSLMQFFNSSDYRFMLGSDVYVAPILSNTTTASVSTFPGTGVQWVYLFDNSRTYTSGSSALFNVPLDEFPVFIKSTSPLLAVLDSVAGTVTGVRELTADASSVIIYPNPATDEIHIAGLDAQAGAVYDFRLSDVLGREVLRSAVANNATLSMEGLECGVYYYRIESKDQPAITGKVIIQR